MRPVYITFPVAGIQVLEGKYFCNESTCRVELSLLGAKSTGNFKCEVSGDAPHFKLAAKEDNMTVAGKCERDGSEAGGRVGQVLNSLLANLSRILQPPTHTHKMAAALPQSDPLIESFNSMYRLEEFLSATCSSDYSSLPTKLTWYINGEQVSASTDRKLHSATQITPPLSRPSFSLFCSCVAAHAGGAATDHRQQHSRPRLHTASPATPGKLLSAGPALLQGRQDTRAQVRGGN